MKDSGIEWLGEIPEHWEVKRIKHLLSEPLKYGANESAEEENLNDPRYIRITDFGNDGKLKANTFKSLPYSKAENFLLSEGDILFARSGATVGKTFFFNNFKGIACFAGYLIKASSDRQLLIPEFLYEFTNTGSYNNWKQSIFQQSTIQNIGADKFNQLKIAIPPISEQKAIVEFLKNKSNEIALIITKTEQEVELLKEYKTALISEVVTGKVDVRNEKLN
jgi:restriction endonuclease S subunit